MKIDSPFHLSWKVSRGGYDWIRGEILKKDGLLRYAEAFPGHRPDPASQDYLAFIMRARELDPTLDSDWMLHARPLSFENKKVGSSGPLKAEPTLFRKFAQTKLSRNAIKRFAKKFGFLGVGAAIRVPGRPDNSYYAEPLTLWARELMTMQMCVDLWRNARTANEEESPRHRDRLAQYIKWRDGEVHFDYRASAQDLGKEYYLIEGRTIMKEEAQQNRLENGDVIAPAFYLLMKEIQHQLAHFAVLPVVSWNPDQQAQQALGFGFQPTNLLAGLWLQLAQAVCADVDYSKCSDCDNWFDTSRGLQGKRSDARYCSNACRSRAYRKRKEQARRCAAEGVSVEEIAQELGSSAEIVRGWLRK